MVCSAFPPVLAGPWARPVEPAPGWWTGLTDPAWTGGSAPAWISWGPTATRWDGRIASRSPRIWWGRWPWKSLGWDRDPRAGSRGGVWLDGWFAGRWAPVGRARWSVCGPRSVPWSVHWRPWGGCRRVGPTGPDRGARPGGRISAHGWTRPIRPACGFRWRPCWRAARRGRPARNTWGPVAGARFARGARPPSGADPRREGSTGPLSSRSRRAWWPIPRPACPGFRMRPPGSSLRFRCS